MPGAPGHDAHGNPKRRKTLETLAMNNRSRRGVGPVRAPFGAVDGNALAARSASFRADIKKTDKQMSPVERTRGLQPTRTHTSSRHDSFSCWTADAGSPMDADETRAWETGDDADFGVPESFHDWLTLVGLHGPLDPNRGGVPVSARQREELHLVWANAAETETLRRLVENLKDGELEMAKDEQMRNEGWAHTFERDTETQWRDRVARALEAETHARHQLREHTQVAEQARGSANEERAAAKSAASETQALRAELRFAALAAERERKRAFSLDQELRGVHDGLARANNELTNARHARDGALREARAEAARAADGFAAEKEAYERVRDEASANEHKRHAEALDHARGEVRELRAAAFLVETRLRETAKDGVDGRHALTQALALREAEAERGRRGADEARESLRLATEKVAFLEGKLREIRAAAETKILGLERALASAKATTTAAETAEANAVEASAKMKQRATEAVANAERKVNEIKLQAERAILAARSETEKAKALAQAFAREAEKSQAAQLTAIGNMPLDDTMRIALERVTKAHSVAVRRYETAEANGEALRTELQCVKRAASASAKDVANALGSVIAGNSNTPNMCLKTGTSDDSLGDLITAQRAELAKVNGEVAKAEAQLREATEKENEIAIAETSSRKLVGASVTPRTRSRTSLRLSHGIPNAANQSPGEFRSPGTELRRRAIAMGLRASPFAAKRKR